MNSISLPAKYYLAHFFELIDNIDRYYQSVIEKPHFDFINDFRALSEDAQCLYVRMVNRKGQVFSKNSLSDYTEVKFLQPALKELKLRNFISPVSEKNKVKLLDFLTKPQLSRWLRASEIEFKISHSKIELLKIAQKNNQKLNLEFLPDFTELLCRSRCLELEYLLFLYFGEIRSGFKIYALRDLGIRKTNEAKNFTKPRFISLEEAKSEYFFSKALKELDSIETLEDIKNFVDQANQFRNLRVSAQNLKNQFFQILAYKSELLDIDFSISLLKNCDCHPARERCSRILYRIGRKEECRKLLDDILLDPRSDEEILFAEDFLNRKFEKKKIGYLSQALLNAKELSLSEAYLKKPERGVRDLYRSQGISAHFTENHLWNGLFGLLFWDELFEKETAALFNPFDRSPSDLVGEYFYEANKKSIEKKLLLFNEYKAIEKHLLKMLSLHHGKLNDIFKWHPNLIPISLAFLKASTNHDVASILRMMSRKFNSYSSGYPDLMLIEHGVARFVEIKAEGDTVSLRQLSKIRFLSDAGFDVQILRVKWETDPNQIYVVVDLETTGGMSQSHRVTEIGAVKVRGGAVLEEFQTLINPGRIIPATITQITGITNKMVELAPSFSEVAEKFDEFTKGAIFVAHNARFDYGFIQREFRRLGKVFVRPQICTVQAMRKNFPGLSSYSLKSLAHHFRINLKTHHRALCDARATTELLHLINEKRSPQLIQVNRDLYCDEFPPEFEFQVG
jgi:DNA polymerase III subunit epsilon